MTASVVAGHLLVLPREGLTSQQHTRKSTEPEPEECRNRRCTSNEHPNSMLRRKTKPGRETHMAHYDTHTQRALGAAVEVISRSRGNKI